MKMRQKSSSTFLVVGEKSCVRSVAFSVKNLPGQGNNGLSAPRGITFLRLCHFPGITMFGREHDLLVVWMWRVRMSGRIQSKKVAAPRGGPALAALSCYQL
jgi:hypothetical protein